MKPGDLRLSEDDPWQVDAPEEICGFLRALPLIAPEGATAYFEGTDDPDVAEYLRGVSIPPQVEVAVGTKRPTDRYHVPLTPDTMEDLASFLERRPAGYFCDHCHVYRGGSVLLEWYDAFRDNPMYVSRTVDREVVARFAQALGSSCRSDMLG